MSIDFVTPSNALIQSLLTSPLLVGDLPNADCFDRRILSAPDESIDLNFDQKLGHLYEDAMAALLNASPGVELAERNLQVRENAQATVGELDFLIRDASGQLVHLELATKFYLAVKANGRVTFPGPDSRDNYDRKLQRLLSHQITLTQRYKAYLPETYQQVDIVVNQLLYGCLFDHIGQAQSSSPEHCNPGCRRGKWLHHRELFDYFSKDSQFDLIPKHLWPVPIGLLKEIPLDPWQPETPITRCQMVRVSDGDCPIFIAPDEYPKQTGP